MPISAFLPKSGHTFCYIRKQITIDISRDIPTFHQPSIGTQMVTSIGISHLFVDIRSTNHRGHFLWHPYFLRSFVSHTNNDTIWDIPSFSLPSIYQPLGTLLGTFILFCCCSIGTQIVTLLGISQHFWPQSNGTLLITPNSSATVLQTQTDTFTLLLKVPFYWTFLLIWYSHNKKGGWLIWSFLLVLHLIMSPKK